MSNFVVEFKKKVNGGFTHARQTVSDLNEVTNIINKATEGGIEGLEFLTIRVVKPKPEPKAKPEVKK